MSDPAERVLRSRLNPAHETRILSALPRLGFIGDGRARPAADGVSACRYAPDERPGLPPSIEAEVLFDSL